MTFDWEFNVWSSLISFLTAIVTINLINIWKKRPKRYVINTDIGEWIDIEITPIPSDIIGKILVTDGVYVEDMYCPLICYNKEGKMCMDRFDSKSSITHWRPFPEPPRNKYGKNSSK